MNNISVQIMVNFKGTTLHLYITLTPRGSFPVKVLVMSSLGAPL